MNKIYFIVFILLSLIFFNSCFPYVYYDQNKVLIENIDINQTLKIAELELAKGGTFSVLSIWAIRDQVINADQAQIISDLYFKYINTLESDFSIWHYAWAISNLYRNNSDEVKNILMDAYLDAKKRPATLKNFKDIANEHVNGDKIYMGPIHDLGVAYSRTHIVAPGNKDYLQSFNEYLEKNKKKEKK